MRGRASSFGRRQYVIRLVRASADVEPQLRAIADRAGATARASISTERPGVPVRKDHGPITWRFRPVTTLSIARPFSVTDAAIRAGIIGLALGTAYIHSTLGGLLFTLNATGYVVFAIALVAPIALASRLRWLVRIGLVGYAATTILGWAITGPYYSTAYVAKAIEVALIVLIAIDFVRFDGSPIAKVRTEIVTALAWLKSRRAEPVGA